MEPLFQRPGPLRLDATNLEEEWKFFLQKFRLYMTASGSSEKPEKTRLAMFLNFVGDEALKVYNTFIFTAPADAEKLDVVINKFKDYCTPRKNVVHERFLFWRLSQQPGESIDTFVTTLRLRAASCEFDNQTESMIRDRIVLGCPDRQLQERLLRENELTLQKALDVCRASEATKGQMKSITADSAVITVVQKQPVKKCGKCGTSHPPKRCPAFGTICNFCRKQNHWSKCCRSVNRDTHTSVNQSQRRRWRSQSRSRNRQSSSVTVNEAEASADETESDELHISACESGVESSWRKEFVIQGTKVNCKLDTGAEANVMSFEVFSRLKNAPNIRNTNTVLTSYSNVSKKPMGVATLQIRHRGKLFNTDFYIVEHCVSTLIGLPTCSTLGVLRRVDGVSSNHKHIFDEFADVFKGLGCYPHDHHIVTDPSVSPVIHPPRRVPLSIQPKLKRQLDNMERLGVISKCEEPTDWVNSLLTVEKKDKSLRLCLDPRDLNMAIKRQHYAIPSCEDVLSRLHGKRVFTIIDMKDGFWQIKLDEASSKLCTFNTPFGRYSFKRLPFGISSAPEVFQKYNEDIFGDISNTHIVFDDLIIAGSDDAEHDQALREVLQRARKYNVRFNKDKLQYKVRQVKYLGHLVSDQGTSADPEKVKSIVEMKPPSCVKELLRFLGMITYLSKYIPNLSSVTEPLRALVKKDMPWMWNNHHQSVFQTLKELVSSAPVLRHFDPGKPTVIQTDASAKGLGSCLLQEGQPVAYVSRALTDAETRYAQCEKELLSVVFACERFCHYIYGQNVTVHSDHKPLESIFRKPISATTPRLQRMLLRLLKFQLRVQYVPGKDMHVADLLSRSYLTTPLTAVEQEVNDDIEVIVHTVVHNTTVSNRMLEVFRSAIQNDPVLIELRTLLSNGDHNDKAALSPEVKQYSKLITDIYEIDGILFLNNKIIVPTELRSDMLRRIHEGHLGMDKCKALARTTLFWPGMSRDIESLISRCSVCNAHCRKQQKETLLPHPVPDLPWQKVVADIFSLYGKDYLLVVDYYSKFPEICHLPNKTASCVILHLKSIFARHGIPDELVSDNMPFASFEMKKFANDWNFTVTTSSPHFSQSNGQVERGIQTVKTLLKKASENGDDPNVALLQYRNAPLADCHFSPAQLLMSRRLRAKLPVKTEVLRPHAST